LCIFKPDGIGDFVLATGAIRLLVNHFGPENCVLVICPMVQALAELEFPETPKLIVPLFRFTFRPSLFWAAIRPRKLLGALQFDQLVCLRHQRLRFQNLVLHWIVADRHFGLINQPDFYLGSDCEFVFGNSDAYPKNAREGTCLELEAHRRVIERSLQREVSADEITPAFRNIRVEPSDYLLVCPFSRISLKNYPSDLLEIATTHIHRRFGLPVMLSCSPEQCEAATALEERLRQRNVLVMPIQRTSGQEYLESVACARAVLTVDTATAHIATALNIPTVVILGGGHYGQFGPWRRSGKQEWVTNSLSCFHCNWRCTELEAYCITRVSPASLEKAMLRVLSVKC
jgi:ADP-heptose:LPS heptosyltransferase